MDTSTLDNFLAEVTALREENRLLREELVRRQPDNQKKLTVREVKEIRNLARVSHLTQKEIADCYDVNPSTISRILKGVYHK